METTLSQFPTTFYTLATIGFLLAGIGSIFQYVPAVFLGAGIVVGNILWLLLAS